MDHISKFAAYLEAGKAAALSEAETLAGENRRDEADWKRVRANIFDAFASVVRASERFAPQEAVAFIRGKIETIPRAWRDALALAQEHGQHRQEAIELVKLETASELGAAFDRLAGEGQ